MFGCRKAITALCLSLAALGCSREPSSESQSTSQIPSESITAPATSPPPKLSPEELAPIIREVAESGVGPTKIVIELAKPVVEEAQIGQALAGTELRIEPTLEGQLRFTSPTTLTFQPTRGFRPNTRYEVELTSLETPAGVLTAPAAGRWVRVFTTPNFDFARFSLTSIDYPRKRAEAQLIFSSAVDPKQVAERARIAVIGKDGRARHDVKVRFGPGPEPHIILAQLTSNSLQGGGRLDLTLSEGVPSALDGDLVTDHSTASADLSVGPMAKILASYRAEGASGFYLQVICNDTSVGSRRYYWDRSQREYYEVSTRCQPNEADAAFGIHFEPPVDYTVSPAGGGFRIFGDFARGSYHMRIESGVRTADGGMFHEAYSTDFTVPARSPTVRFVSKGRYLPRTAWTSLPVRHRNVSGATLSIRHVPAENLVFWMGDDSDESASERTSNLVIRQQIALGGDTDVESTTYVDLASLVPPTTRGLIELRVEAGAAKDTARILLTDLHLIAKRSGGENRPTVRAWALDMDSLAPVRGAEIRLIRKSGYALSTCKTGRDGGCDLQASAEELDPTSPFALLAIADDDLTYLKFSELEAEVQETRIAGEPYGDETRKYRASLYSDRGVYRPGETAHLAAIVRQHDHLAPPADMPVVAKLTDPRGKVLKRTTLTTNAAGFVELDVDFAAFATTGRYEAQLEVADHPIGQYRFQVEEFVPERMKVEVETADPEYLLGESMAVTVASRYLFGGVPAKHKVEVSCEIAPSNFLPESNSNFHYGVWRPENSPVRPLALGSITAELDDVGAGTFSCPGAGRAGGFSGPAELVARAAVFESGSGRTTVNQATAPVHPESFYIGLMSGTTKVGAGNELVVEGVTVDWQGALSRETEAVELEFIRLETEYGWTYDETRGHETYRRYLRPVTESSTSVSVIDGKFRATWKPGRDAVGFLVRAQAGAARTDLELEGHGDWYYWAPDETEVDLTPRPGRPAWLSLETPPVVQAGTPFPVHFKVPYGGRVLLTAETDKLLRSEWMDVDAGDAVWQVELEEFTPNVYVTAFLVKDPHLDSPQAFLPDRAFGVQSVTVEPRDFTRPLQLDVPSEVRSNTRLTVALDLGAGDGPTYATVAAVDEGILSLTRFQSPDPFSDIFARRALGVETFETIGWTLLVPPSGPSATTGGDGAGSLGRVQPVKPVALWSGLVEVPASGKLEVDFEVPQYRGELRIMAVAADGRSMARADAQVTVRDPLVVQATLPRFLTRDDDIRVPVFVTNVSGTRREIDVSLSAAALDIGGLDAGTLDSNSSPVEIVGPTRRTLTLDHGASDTVVFRTRALRSSGAARLEVVARSGQDTSIEHSDVPLLPAGPKSRRVQRIELEEGRLDLTPLLDGWVPLSERSTIWVTNNPYGDTFSHLEHLLRYPYGCLEQTTSSTRPLLYLANFVNSVDPALLADKNIEDMVQHGLRRLLSMQTPDGGFAYWPGASEPAYWGTAYATHLLLDAQKLGYEVTQERLDDALDWMDRQITNTFEAGRQRNSWYSSNSEPYMHLVLARAGRARQARAEKLIQEMPKSPRREQREHLYMLQAALYEAGDQRYENQLRRPDLSTLSDHRDNGWSFYSDRRRRGFMLSTFADLFGSDAAGDSLAQLVAEGLRGHHSRWYTTQELVWGITGLGKYLEAGAEDFDPPQLLAQGKRLTPQPSQRKTADRTWSLVRASEYRELELDIPSIGDGKLYLILASEGVRTVPDWRTGGEGLLLSRRYLDAAGQPLDLNLGQTLGDLVHVELTLRNNSAERISNIALVDRIPAGWEIENPRLGRGSAISWLDADQLWQVDHLDLRDDRIELFGHLKKGEVRKVVYAARAVTAGRFTIPSVEAEAMYDPRIWAREGMQKVEIAGPWATAGPITPGAE